MPADPERSFSRMKNNVGVLISNYPQRWCLTMVAGRKGREAGMKEGGGANFILLVCMEFLIHYRVLVTADMVLLYAFLHVSGFLLGNAFVC